MSRSSALILVGVLTMLTPFSGLPSSIRTLLTLLFGAVALGVGIAERAETVRRARASLSPEQPSPHGVSSL